MALDHLRYSGWLGPGLLAGPAIHYGAGQGNFGGRVMWAKIIRFILQVIALFRKDQNQEQAETQEEIQEVQSETDQEKAKVDTESGDQLNDTIDSLMHPPTKD